MKFKTPEKNRRSSNDYQKRIKQDPRVRQKINARTAQAVRKWREKNPLKLIAQRKVFIALRNGSLTKKPCRKCRATKVEAHHDDYTKPLKVVWLCKKHHMEADARRRVIHIR